MNKKRIAQGAAAGAMAVILGAGGFALGTTTGGEVPGQTGEVRQYETAAEEKEFAVLLYMVGSDLESAAGAASANLEELLDADIDYASVGIVGQAGGSEKWHNEFTPYANTRFVVEDGELAVQEVLEGVNMGESLALADFLRYGMAQCPAKQTILVLWNHGEGPVGGFGSDECYAFDSLTLAELQTAFTAAGCGEERLALVGFDACCMAGLEVAAALQPYAKTMLASQEMEPGGGWDYEWLSALRPGAGIDEVIARIADGYMEKHEGLMSMDLTLSAIDLDALGPLLGAVEGLGLALSDGNGFDGLAARRGEARSFGAVGNRGGQSDLVDLLSLAEVLEQDMEQSLAEAVLYKVGEGSGLNLYFPYYALQDVEKQLAEYTAPGFAEGYTRFVDSYARWLTGGETPEYWPEAEQEGEYFAAGLDAGALESLHKALFTLWRPTGQEGWYALLGSESTVEIIEEGVTYRYDGSWTHLGGVPLCTIEMDGPVDMYTRFTSPVLLNGQAANLVLQYDYDNPYGKLLYAVPWGTNGQAYSKQIVLLQEGDSIQPLYPVFPFEEEDSDGEAAPQPEFIGEVEGYMAGEAIVYGDMAVLEELPVFGNAMYGFCFVTNRNESYFSTFIDVELESGWQANAA